MMMHKMINNIINKTGMMKTGMTGMMTPEKMQELKRIAQELRRQSVLMTHQAGSGHPGGSLSQAEILTALYFFRMKHNPKNPQDPQRDICILSKGHCCPSFYAVLAEAGYFPKEELMSFRSMGSRLQGHVYAEVPGVELSTGSLGQGLSVGAGMALSFKIDKKPNRVFVLLGDGEMQEGSVWEAVMFAGRHQLNNLTAIVDFNGVQQEGFTNVILDMNTQERPLAKKFAEFGWHAIEINGNNMEEVVDALRKVTSLKPLVIISHTKKGAGVSFMELNKAFHGKAPNDEELKQALEEIKQKGAQKEVNRL